MKELRNDNQDLRREFSDLRRLVSPEAEEEVSMRNLPTQPTVQRSNKKAYQDESEKTKERFLIPHRKINPQNLYPTGRY